ncbi:aldo/keto reductase [Leucobacter sp. CSA1]|uniref:Aldo/keto reductase n=1 Tax=Leucobacter chromiisoli TaxID=2796471 RepID=A0A934Q4S7_9MICO|nr:aldo/keto reductase [Leucobacter chromiisoli]MBK0417430.1 aldo/keto reductase [Leucobacter chromiisoli]
MEHVVLNTGAEMPVLGFGVYLIPPEETERAVREALDAGYRSVDTAEGYGNEAAVGRALAASGIPREELFVTTKLSPKHTHAEGARRSFDASRRRLGLDRIDLYLVHAPYGDYYGAWRTMQDLHREGPAGAIGVSNFPAPRVADLIEHHEIAPAVDQIETHPLHQRRADQEALRTLGVVTESWGPLAQAKGGLLSDPVLTGIGERHGRSPAQVVLRWLIQRGIVAIPKTVRVERMRENLDVFGFELSADEMRGIAALDRGAPLWEGWPDPDRMPPLDQLHGE